MDIILMLARLTAIMGRTGSRVECSSERARGMAGAAAGAGVVGAVAGVTDALVGGMDVAAGVTDTATTDARLMEDAGMRAADIVELAGSMVASGIMARQRAGSTVVVEDSMAAVADMAVVVTGN